MPEQVVVEVHPSDRAVHEVRLAAGVETCVRLQRGRWSAPTVEVLSLDGDAAVYATVDGTEPTVRGGNSRVLPAAVHSITLPCVVIGDHVEVRLVSEGAPLLSVGWA